MKKNNTNISGNMSYVTFTLLIAIYFTLIVNIPIYKELNTILSQLDNVKTGFIISIPFFILAILNFLFNIFSWPWITKPFFIILLIISGSLSYAGYNYGTLFDYNMMVNIAEEDNSKIIPHISVYSLFWVFLIGITPALLVLRVSLEKKITPIKLLVTKAVSMLLSIIIIAIITTLYYQDYTSVERQNTALKNSIIPTQFLYNVGGYIKKTYFSQPIPYKQIGLDARQHSKAHAENTKPTLLVFVVGETARSQNYELNGYHRPTNKHTRDLDIISFQDVNSCGTATATSVPCMFSSLTHGNFDRSRADNQDNLLDIMQRAQVSLLWKENDGGDKGVATNIPQITIDRSRKDDMCNGSTCYDMALLEDFEENVESLTGNRMVALHLIGSHGPTYYQRYPREKTAFLPVCRRADIENCTTEEIKNTYDNSIVYTDYVISQTIKKLTTLKDKFNTALVYVSDHGESLGENGIFSHDYPYTSAPKYQTKVPLMMWMSPSFKKEKSINYKCLERRSQFKNTYSHDNIFHSILGIMDIDTEEYDKTLDLFSLCRAS